MLCVMALEEGGVHPDDGDILVTGASGGVGSTAIALLAALGYRVTAISGRDSNTDYLKALGAKEVMSRDGYIDTPRPLEKTAVGRRGGHRRRQTAGAGAGADEL